MPAISTAAACLPTVAQSVLIVDESQESRDVLRTVLERRGMQIWEASGARQGLEIAQHHHPDVIVLDMDAEFAEDSSIQAGFDVESRDHHSSLLVLGKARKYSRQVPSDCVLAKPYHYGPLVHKIEQLLAAAERTIQ